MLDKLFLWEDFLTVNVHQECLDATGGWTGMILAQSVQIYIINEKKVLPPLSVTLTEDFPLLSFHNFPMKRRLLYASLIFPSEWLEEVLPVLHFILHDFVSYWYHGITLKPKNTIITFPSLKQRYIAIYNAGSQASVWRKFCQADIQCETGSKSLAVRFSSPLNDHLIVVVKFPDPRVNHMSWTTWLTLYHSQSIVIVILYLYLLLSEIRF